MNADEQRAYDTLQARNDALAMSLVDLFERDARTQEQLATAQRALIAIRNELANSVFPRLDRIENEMEIDEQLPLPIDDVDVTQGRVL